MPEDLVTRTVLSNLEKTHGNKKITIRVRVSQLRRAVQTGSELGKCFVEDISEKALKHIKSASIK